MACNFIKISLLQSFVITNNYDIIFLTETLLDSSFDYDDNRIFIPVYNLLHIDHPTNTKRGGVCIYYKDHLPVKKRNDLCQLRGCLVIDLRIEKKKELFLCMLTSPSQTSNESEYFCSDLNLFLSNINDLIIVLL